MNMLGWFSRLSNQQPSLAIVRGIAAGVGVAILLGVTGNAGAQTVAPVPEPVVPNGYSVHQSVDFGGRMVGLSGSGSMYDTLVNDQSGPRMQGETFEMRALPDNKHSFFDSLRAVSSGFGGDPNNFAKLDFSKGKFYDFSGLFRRDRQYSDYDLLGNPNITTGQSIAITGSTTPLAWPQVKDSPVMFNTVRRMTDTSLTIFPLARLTYRFGYSQNIFQGPSLSPGESVGKYNSLLSEYQRNSTDDFTGAVDWKPVQGTKLTFEEQVDHFKTGSYFTIAPSEFMVQEADGTPVSLGDWDSQTAYTTSACATGTTSILTPATTAGGKPIINPACDVVTSYLRSQPTRILTPTEIFRLQSTSIKNISMNGNFTYTSAKMNLPNYYENFQGLDITTTAPAGGIRSMTFTGNASARRIVAAGDYGIVWQAMKSVSISEQIDYSNVHQPGTSNISAGATMETPSTSETINYTGALTPGAASTVEGSANGAPLPAYFGQRMLTNNFGVSWDATSRTTFSLTYRYRTHMIAENAYSAATTTAPVDYGGNPGNVPLAVGADTNGTVTIDENGGIFNAALRLTSNWDLNGTVEMLYDDNAFTPVAPRQTKHYRVHTMYRPKTWATLTGAFNDLERHNNTNENAVTGSTYDGPLGHVDHSRVVSLGADLAPNEHYGLDFNYAYTDVYAATNICYLNGSPTSGTSTSLPGAVPSPNSKLCPGVYTRGSTILSDWGPASDFMDAPTQYGSVSLVLSPTKTVHSNIGYRISSVNGSRFFNDARDVNGSLVSSYQSPYVDFAWTPRPSWTWKAEYNYFGYGEGGPSGSPYCSTSTTVGATIVPCNSPVLTGPTGLTEASSGLTAPRNFHANNVSLGLHYEF
jgi:hypothetical protein